MLHRHLCDLIGGSAPATRRVPELDPVQPDPVQALCSRARAQALSSQRALDALPALPQFSCTMEHARLTLRQQRAALALDVLERLR